MTTHKSSLLLASASVAALSISAFAVMGTVPAGAVCFGEPSGVGDGTNGYDGGNDPDTITCDAIPPNGGGGSGVTGGGKGDTITLLGSTHTIVQGNDGDDVIDMQGGTVGSTIEGNEGDDTITVAGYVETSVLGDARTDGNNGNDTITLLAGSDVFRVFGDSDFADLAEEDGDDVITLVDGAVFDSIFGEGGDDEIVMLSGSVGGDVQGNEGNDLIMVKGGTIAVDVEGNSGNDTIIMTGGTVGEDVEGNSGNDVFDISGGFVTGAVIGDVTGLPDGDDTIRLNGGNVGAIFGDRDEEDEFNGDDGDDTIMMTSGTVRGAVFGEGGDDRIVLDGALVSGTIHGDGIDGEAGNDFILILDGTVGVSVRGGPGDDRVTLVGGSIGDQALGGSGDDVGVVSGGFDFDNLGGGAGNFAGDKNSGPSMDIGDDTLNLFSWTGAVNADRLPEWNRVEIGLFSNVTFTGGELSTGGDSDIELFIDLSSSMLLSENLSILGNVTNQGRIDLSSANMDPDNQLSIMGNYTASSGLKLDTFLNDGSIDITDAVFISGDTSGTTFVDVVNSGGPGGLTGTGPSDGILLVEVDGVSSGDFIFSNDVVADIYEYDLVQANGRDWSLQSDYLEQIYVYEALPGALQSIGLALTGQLVERVGVRTAVPSTLTGSDGNPVLGGQPVDTAIWGRAVGLSLESEGDLDSTTGGTFDQTIGFLQAGVDLAVLQRQSGRLIIGALGHWGTSSLDVNGADNAARGSADFDFYGGGLTATWYSAGGWYFDNVVQYTAYDIDISTVSRFSETSTDGYGFAASHELGYRIPISQTAALVPQAQITYQRIDFDDFIDPDGVLVGLDDGDSLVGRLGVAFENSAAIGSSLVTGYVEANLLHEFLGDNSVTVTTDIGTTALNQDLGGTSVEVGFGGTIAVNSGVSLYGEIDYTIPFDNGVQGFQALAGVRVNLNPVAPPPPAPVIAPVAETAFIVFFDWDRANLTPEANLVLDDVVVTANQSGYASVRLDGYTDLSGSAAYNLGLSERRANSVADGLIARGIAPDEIVIRAFGEENPLVPTPDGVREPQNRRVEIFLS